MIQIPIIKAVCQVVPDKKICYVLYKPMENMSIMSGPQLALGP